MTQADLDAFRRALADGREVRLRLGEALYFGHPISIVDDKITVRMRGGRIGTYGPSAVTEIRIAGEP